MTTLTDLSRMICPQSALSTNHSCNQEHPTCCRSSFYSFLPKPRNASNKWELSLYQFIKTVTHCKWKIMLQFETKLPGKLVQHSTIFVLCGTHQYRAKLWISAFFSCMAISKCHFIFKSQHGILRSEKKDVYLSVSVCYCPLQTVGYFVLTAFVTCPNLTDKGEYL